MKNAKMIQAMIGAVALMAAGSALASSLSEKTGYLIDARGEVARNAYGECWRTGYWTPAMAIAECDGKLSGRRPDGGGPDDPAFGKVTLQAETLFDFDKSELRPAGKSVLDEFVTKMKANPNVELLLVTGYTDQIGSDAYNLALSKRRAAAVKAYLVSKGIEAKRIETVGKGEKDPVKSIKECKGQKGKKLIECLQPNRRVVVEIKMQKPMSK